MSSTIVMSSDDESSSIDIRKESQFDDSVDSFSILSSSPPRRPASATSRRTTNTGPKGVRADARAYEASKRERLAGGNTLLAAPATSFAESGSDASEDEWMSRWREKRMKELSTSGVAGVNLFGQVDDVDARGYLNAVDFEDTTEENTAVTSKRARARRNVVTVVLIYNNSPDSKSLFQVFSRLARRHPTTHFLRLPSQYAEDMPSTALPAVLAYRRGQLIANLVHIVDELVPGASVNVNTIETILSKEGVLPLAEPESDESI